MKNNQQAFYVDTLKCINCKTCEIACQEINQSLPGEKLRTVHTIETGSFPSVIVYNVSASCHHCENPTCLTACPTNAYTKRPEDGLVILDQEKCVGCKLCLKACPYGAPQYNSRTRKVQKCNMCLGNIEKDEHPACVDACPTRAIEICPFTEIANRSDTTMAITNFPSPLLTRPTSRYRLRKEVLNV